MPDTSEEKPAIETITLPTGGAIPGIPGHHGPGAYLVDWLERTATPIIHAIEAAVERAEQDIQPEAEQPALTEPTPEPATGETTQL